MKPSQHKDIHFLCISGQTLSSGPIKYSISICSNSRERNMKFRGVISFLNAFPICAIPKGIFCLETWDVANFCDGILKPMLAVPQPVRLSKFKYGPREHF